MSYTPRINVEAISDDATARAILLSFLSLAIIKIVKNIFPVPRVAFTKNISFPVHNSFSDGLIYHLLVIIEYSYMIFYIFTFLGLYEVYLSLLLIVYLNV